MSVDETQFRAIVDILVRDEEWRSFNQRIVDDMKAQEAAANELTDRLTNAYVNVERGMGVRPTGEAAQYQYRMWREKAVSDLQTPSGEAVISSWRQAKAPAEAGQSWEDITSKVRSFQGIISNAVHSYYWLESAQIRTENAQLRLINAQESYNRALREHGGASSQAQSAYRTLEMAQNNLERAHAREILNIALVGGQLVMMISNIGKLATGWMAEAAAVEVNTAAIMKNNAARATGGGAGVVSGAGGGGGMGGILGLAMAHPVAAAVTLAAVATIGAAMYFQNRSLEESAAQRQREIMGTSAAGETRPPFWQSKPGTLPSEQLFNEAHPSGLNIIVGGNNIVVLKDTAEQSIDDALSKQGADVKNQLRRLLK